MRRFRWTAFAVSLGTVALAADGGVAAEAHHWCLQRGSDPDGNPVIIVADLELKKVPAARRHPFLVYVNLEAIERRKNGLPSRREAAALDDVEDAITDALHAAGPFQFVGHVTTNSGRELIYYVPNAEKANAALTPLSRAKRSRAWEYRISRDPEWQKADSLMGDEHDCVTEEPRK